MFSIMKRTYDAQGVGINKLDVEIRYELGGMNYFFGKPEQRGYYFSVSPYKYVDHGGYSSREFTVGANGHGVKACILPCERRSKKRFQTACAMYDELFETFLAKWLAENGITISDEYVESIY